MAAGLSCPASLKMVRCGGGRNFASKLKWLVLPAIRSNQRREWTTALLQARITYCRKGAKFFQIARS